VREERRLEGFKKKKNLGAHDDERRKSELIPMPPFPRSRFYTSLRNLPSAGSVLRIEAPKRESIDKWAL
jgi:hypothetical protein